MGKMHDSIRDAAEVGLATYSVFDEGQVHQMSVGCHVRRVKIIAKRRFKLVVAGLHRLCARSWLSGN